MQTVNESATINQSLNQSTNNPKNEPLGLPKGSIRAILAIIITGLVVPSSIAGMIILFVYNQYNGALGICSALLSILSGIVGFYFGHKTASNNIDTLKEAHTNTLNSKNEVIDLLKNRLV